MFDTTHARKIARVGRWKARAPLRALKNFSNPLRFLKPSGFPLRGFKPKVQILQTSETFILKTAETPFELQQALRLRHEIFYRELQNKETDSRLDVDELDSLCDHLIIIDKQSSQVVGTYRLISSDFSDRFYSQGEFEISEVLRLPGTKLELGRACIHAEYRSGAIINLLWKGIAEYIRKTDAKYLFGCASIQTTDLMEAARLTSYLRAEGLLSDEFNVQPTSNYLVDLPAVSDPALDPKSLPALIQSYVLANAKFYGPPALDKDFQCFDFFMMLKVDEMSKLFRRRYMGEKPGQ
jgi:putative hemolysin